MHAAVPATPSAPTRLSDRSIPVRVRPFILTPAHRQPIDRIFAQAIVLCMSEGRRPSGHEIGALAARIWSDIQPGPRKVPWDDVMPGSRQHRRIVAAARAALGDTARDGEPP